MKCQFSATNNIWDISITRGTFKSIQDDDGSVDDDNDGDDDE